MESLNSVMTRVRAVASRRASRSETKSLGSSEAAPASSSSSRAAVIDQRRSKGLRASRLMRLPAETTPMTRPRASTTGRWFTPACIISMLASGASTSSRTVLTGIVMIEPTGASGEMPPASTFRRRSASVTMPRPMLRGDEDRGHRLVAHELSRFADRRGRFAEHGPTSYQAGHGDGKDVRHLPRRLSCTDEPVSKRMSDEGDALRGAQDRQSDLARDEVQDCFLAPGR